MSLVRNLERAQRIHRFIKFKRTGTPQEFAEKMGLSQSMLYNVLGEMKQLGAPIGYCRFRQSYIYTRDVDLKAGFYPPLVLEKKFELQNVQGGAKIIPVYPVMYA